jgi:hypothetical protein
MLYLLSYASLKKGNVPRSRRPRLRALDGRAGMERETGIEPATNSLEGCDSTIELLPLALSV